MSIEASTVDDRLRLLESCVRGIVMEFDEAGRYLEVWTHDESLLARPRAQLLGATINEVLGVEVGTHFMEMLRLARVHKQVSRVEYPLTVLGGARWFAAEAFPGQRPGTAVLLVQDITDRKNLEARLMESDRLAAIGLLAGGVGHEINNPLAWVMTRLSTLHAGLAARSHESDPAFARWAAQVSEALDGSERISQIVRDLAYFARSPEAENKPVDLQRALEWAAGMSSAELRQRARLVKVYGQAPRVSGSEARLGQVFLNLLINAAQAIDEGSAERNEVRIELSTDDRGRARVDVSDTGKGIPPEHLPRLFEPFFTTKPRGMGTGLGLAVSRRIVESLGGSLDVVASGTPQTLFRVTLPAGTERSMTEATPDAPEWPRAHLRVLVVDDQARFLSSLRAALEPAHDVQTETSAKAALARLRQGERFDAVVCDLMMPDLTGVDFYEAVAAELPGFLTRIVFMTGGAFTTRARDFLRTVPNARIEKPFRPEQLEALLARVCAP